MRFRKILLTALTLLFALLLVCSQGLAAGEKVTKYVRFRAAKTVAYGIVEGDRVRQLDGNLFRSWRPTDTIHKLSEVKLLAPSRPSKVLAAALNYKSHAGEKAPPTEPQLFFKSPTSVVAPGGKVVIPKGTADVHYEAEMVIVIGRRAKNVPEDKALDYVLGVTCGNDISARDWQSDDIQWWRAKGSDTFGPCGPMIVSGIDYDDLLLQLRHNGEVKQKERTSRMIFSVAELVSFVSRHVTLEPGDLIFTGTPGTTAGIKPGDVLEVELEGVGVLQNTVVGAR
ncbi:MAG: fumarylacetoacetate hydrolase family protein [Planctomycetota bacterium]|jgi:2-keto-4-pentenoate hydratase/2-oxohepta-3-ene-1,7-dioic acid hydratase in catechol pathway